MAQAHGVNVAFFRRVHQRGDAVFFLCVIRSVAPVQKAPDELRPALLCRAAQCFTHNGCTAPSICAYSASCRARAFA